MNEVFLEKNHLNASCLFYFDFQSLFLSFFFWARNFTFGRTSPANILMKKHHPITSQLFDHMTFQRLFIYSQSTLLLYHHIKVLLREKKELEGIPDLRSFFMKNPGKLNNRLCLATVSLDCISNDFVSLSHCAPTSMVKQWSVVCVNFSRFIICHSLPREDQ